MICLFVGQKIHLVQNNCIVIKNLANVLTSHGLHMNVKVLDKIIEEPKDCTSVMVVMFLNKFFMKKKNCTKRS